jgi:hypothetical protein
MGGKKKCIKETFGTYFITNLVEADFNSSSLNGLSMSWIIQDQSVWDLWCIKGHCSRFFPCTSVVPQSASFHQCSIPIHSSAADRHCIIAAVDGAMPLGTHFQWMTHTACCDYHVCHSQTLSRDGAVADVTWNLLCLWNGGNDSLWTNNFFFWLWKCFLSTWISLYSEILKRWVLS